MAVRSSSTARRTALALVALALLVAIVPAHAAAQVADPSVSVALSQDALELGAANTTEVTATVTNANANIAGTVVVTVEPPAGWTAVASPSTIPLAGGASQEVTITLTAPDVGVGAQTGGLTFTAVITENNAPGRTAQASETLALTRVDPLPPPPPPPVWYQTAGGIALIALTTLLVVGVSVGVVLARRRRARIAAEAAAAAQAAYLERETGISIALTEAPHAFGPKRDILLRVTIQNTSQRPRVALVRVEPPAGWTGAPNVPRAPLEPGEQLTLSIVVSPPAEAAPDAVAPVSVIVKPEEARERDERVQVDVVAPAVRLTPAGSVPVAGQSLRHTANQRTNVR